MSDTKLSNEEKLDLIYEMTKENHDTLQSLKRQQYVSNIFRVLYWLVVLGALGSTYYYIRPFISYLTENSGKLMDLFGQLRSLQNSLPEAQMLNGLMEGLKKSATGGQ